jgi:hypothetical protein
MFCLRNQLEVDYLRYGTLQIVNYQHHRSFLAQTKLLVLWMAMTSSSHFSLSIISYIVRLEGIRKHVCLRYCNTDSVFCHYGEGLPNADHNLSSSFDLDPLLR